jgi:hypothetical protein
MKTCTYCKQEKPYSDFHPDKGAKDGAYYICRPCHISHLKQRMYINGEYVSKKDPLYKPGNYRTLSDAWSHAEIEKVPQGDVYIVQNPAWPSWYKVGKAADAEDRLRHFQTSSPLRDYKLMYSKHFEDRHAGEVAVHEELRKVAFDYRKEWFYTEYEVVTGIIEETHALLSSGHRDKQSA